MKAAWELLKEAFAGWSEHRAPRLGAALAYFAMFSIAPVLLIAIAIAGLVFGRAATEAQILTTIHATVGENSAKLVQSLLDSASQPGAGILATVIGVVTILLGAAGLFFQLKDSLNTVWEVTPKPNYGIRDMIRDNLLSFTMVLGIGFLLLVSLVLSAAVSALSAFLGRLFPGTEFLWHLVDFGISFAVVTMLFAAIFKILPDVQIAWPDVWVGAILTALLFTLGKLALGFYIGRSNPGLAFGTAGSLVVILVWVNFSSLILLFGAEFTRVWTQKYGSLARPEPYAVPLTEEARARQGMPLLETVEQATRAGNQPATPDVADGEVERTPPELGLKPKRRGGMAVGVAIGVAGVIAVEIAGITLSLVRLFRRWRGGGSLLG